MAANGSPEKLSPMRSLSSFKSEMLLTMENPSKKQKHPTLFQHHLDHIINGVPLHVVILVLILGNCFVVATELLFAYNMILIDDKDEKSVILRTLSATSLALLSLFLLEVVVRIFSMGLNFKRKKLEIFDACVVLVTFVSDLVFFNLEPRDKNCFTRAFSFIIILRMWRCWGILRGAKKRVREETACELQMEKYARRQAEAQADALQTQCDQQLKEIAYLRDFLHQNNLDPDTTKLDFVPKYQTSASISSAIHYYKADTLPMNDKLSKDASLDSIASSSKDPPTSISSSQNVYSEPPTVTSGTATSSNSPSHQITNEQFASQASRQIVQDAMSEVQERMPPGHRGLTNPGFTPDEDGVPASGLVLRITEERKPNDGARNQGFENDSLEPDSPGGSGKTDSEEDSEAQLRYELDEIKRLSDEALQSELASLTQDVDGIPTTSL